MAKRPTDEGSDAMRMFGSAAKAFRMVAGLTHEQVAAYVGYSKSMVVCVERGTRMPSDTMVHKLDECCNARGVLIEAAKHLSRQRYPSWFEEYAMEEQKALTLLVYDTHLPKGLLQTEEYARAVFTAVHPALEEEEIVDRVEARLARHELLGRKPACSISFVIEEAALCRPMCGPEGMKRQMEHLIELAAERNISIQIMPNAHAPHAGVDGPMTLLETPEHKWLAYFEAQGNSQLISDADRVSVLHERYSMIRSQALTPRDSARFMKRLAGEL